MDVPPESPGAGLDTFFRFNEREILQDAGRVSMDIAQRLAVEEYEKFSRRRITDDASAPDEDFDFLVKSLEKKKAGIQKEVVIDCIDICR